VTEQVGGLGRGTRPMPTVWRLVFSKRPTPTSRVPRHHPFAGVAGAGFSSFGDGSGCWRHAMADLLGARQHLRADLAVGGGLILRLAPSVWSARGGALADRISRRWCGYGDVLRFASMATVPSSAPCGALRRDSDDRCASALWLPAKDATSQTWCRAKRLEAANRSGMVATYGTAPIAALPFRAGAGQRHCWSTRSPASGWNPGAPTRHLDRTRSLPRVWHGHWRLASRRTVTRSPRTAADGRASSRRWRFVGAQR